MITKLVETRTEPTKVLAKVVQDEKETQIEKETTRLSDELPELLMTLEKTQSSGYQGPQLNEAPKLACPQCKVPSELAVVGINSKGWTDGTFQLAKEHVNFGISEVVDDMKLDGSDANGLLKILDGLTISSDEFTIYGQANTSVTNKQSAQSKLKTIVDYCETHEKASPNAKKKLRYITKRLLEEEFKDMATPMLLLLASNGEMCHVMKESAVDLAYGMMTGTVKEDVEKQTLDQLVLRLLRELRYLIAEEIHMLNKGSNNTHYITATKNYLAKDIGVPVIPDRQANGTDYDFSNHFQKPELVTKFWELYTPERVAKWISTCINAKPQKIPCQKVVKWFEANAPSGAAYVFMSEAIDLDTGNVRDKYVNWMLSQMKVFTGPEVVFEPLMSCKKCQEESCS